MNYEHIETTINRYKPVTSAFFSVIEVVALLILSLNFRPGHKESLDRALQSEESAVRLDLCHALI